MSQEKCDSNIAEVSYRDETNEKIKANDSVEVKANVDESNLGTSLSNTEHIDKLSNLERETFSGGPILNSSKSDSIDMKSSKNKLDNGKQDTSNGISEAGENNQSKDILSNHENQENAEHPAYDPANVHYEGDIAVYVDPTTGYRYRWDKDEEKWIPKADMVYGFEDDTHVYTDADGTKFFWDKEKNAWFPKINDDFMAQYQINYGFINNTTTTEVDPQKEVEKIVKEKEKEPQGVKRKPNEPSWFEMDEQHNTKVYVSNLPTDITEEEFVDLMQKYGLIMRDPVTQKMKVKLYKEPGTEYLKGDALCTYIRVESVDLAIKLLDNSMFKDKKIRIERAKFQMRGAYDPKLKPKTKKRKEKEKLKRMQEKLFDWRPEKMIGERAKHEKVVIVKNVFNPNVFDEEVGLILEYQQDLREECAKCGDVRKVIVYDRHPEGVIQVNMKEPEEADAVVTLLNGRWFGKRQLSAEIWNGKTKYKIAETDSEISQRINKWDKFLEGENDSKSDVKL